jgi:hypothetical protein
MKLPPGWIELRQTESFQREDLLMVSRLKDPSLGVEDWFRIMFLHPARFDAGDEDAFDSLERIYIPELNRKPGWLATLLKEYGRESPTWRARGTLTIDLVCEIDRLFRRRNIFAPSPDVHRELSDRERIELLEQQVAELKRRLDASE